MDSTQFRCAVTYVTAIFSLPYLDCKQYLFSLQVGENEHERYTNDEARSLSRSSSTTLQQKRDFSRSTSYQVCQCINIIRRIKLLATCIPRCKGAFGVSLKNVPDIETSAEKQSFNPRPLSCNIPLRQKKLI